jgi:hypothetical protein
VFKIIVVTNVKISKNCFFLSGLYGPSHGPTTIFVKCWDETKEVLQKESGRRLCHIYSRCTIDISPLDSRCLYQPELGLRYFFPYSLFALPLLQHLFSLSLLCYFSENCNTLLAIATFVSSVLRTASIIGLYLR